MQLIAFHYIVPGENKCWLTQVWVARGVDWGHESHLEFSPKSLDRFLSSFQTTRKASHLAKCQVTSVVDLEINWVALTSLFVFCIFLNRYMWHHMICFTIYYKRQTAFSSLMNCVFDVNGSHSIVGYKNLSMGCYDAAFCDVTIVLTRDATIMMTPKHGGVNNASLGEQ